MSFGNETLRVPLAAIRAFEAAARLGSFTQAARELGLTQGAISRHVRALEDEFGTKLFNRIGRSVVLTRHGEAYYSRVGEGLQLIRLATREMQQRTRRTNQLTISLLPSVAALWLAPRLADFTARNPNVELHVHASRALVDFAFESVDLGIRYGLGDWPEVRCEKLATETLTPVCSAAFAAEHGLGTDPRALLSVPLLADDLVDDWEDWLRAAGIEKVSPRAPTRMNDSASVYHAAASGLGVALGRSLLIEQPIKEGRLVAPFELSVPAAYSYWLVLPDRGVPSPATRLFARWALEQAEASR